MRNVGKFYGNFKYCTVIWYIFESFGKFFGRFVYFPRFGMFFIKKSGIPGTNGSGHSILCGEGPILQNLEESGVNVIMEEKNWRKHSLFLF
jgi:hypothetical protein